MKAVYGGKTKSEITNVAIPEVQSNTKAIEIAIDPYTGCLSSIKADGKEVLKTPMRWNILRYIDNDRRLAWLWNTKYRLPECRPEVFSCEKTPTGYKATGVIGANCILPLVAFTVEYIVENNCLSVVVDYEISGHVEHLPRFGLEFGVDKNYDKFAFVGFGKAESYIDKNIACEYGYYESSAQENYDNNYIRPQESGSHYASKYLCVNDLFAVTADRPFSFSVNPYTSKQLYETTHNFDLPKNDFVNICLDLAMRGIGSASCGPNLDKEYEVPKSGKNTFKIKFL
jgi:beta-galactosidase